MYVDSTFNFTSTNTTFRFNITTNIKSYTMEKRDTLDNIPTASTFVAVIACALVLFLAIVVYFLVFSPAAKARRTQKKKKTHRSTSRSTSRRSAPREEGNSDAEMRDLEQGTLPAPAPVALLRSGPE